jgi:hypothetical protein
LSGHGIEAHGVSGLNVWIPVPDESRVVSALLARGWAVTAGERYRIATAPAIRVTVSDLGARDASRFADDLAGVLAPAARASVS